jgi:DNA-directed RNA polymerase subunit RPC12/RpoP
MPPASPNHDSWALNEFESESSSTNQEHSSPQIYGSSMPWTPTEAYRLVEELLFGDVKPRSNLDNARSMLQEHPSPALSPSHSILIAESNVCITCKRSFQRPSDLRRHEKQHKGPNISCTAPMCDRRFHRMNKMKDHVRRVHDRASNPARRQIATLFIHECPDCDKFIFHTKPHYTRHRLTHLSRNDRPFKCAKCDATFYWAKDLKRTYIPQLCNLISG